MTDAELIAALRSNWPVAAQAADRIEALISERDTIIKINNGWAMENEDLLAERDALKHDIERHIKIAADLATENEELRQRLANLLSAAASESPAPPQP